MSDYIHEDNLSLILRCLPVRTLLRFRCVCKRWKEVIDSPLFVQEHLSLQNPNFIFQNEASSEMYALSHALPSVNLLNYDIEDQHDLPEDLILCHGHPLFLATHNGVVCFCDFSSWSGASRNNKFVVWNPSVRMHLTVEIPDFWDCGWEYEDESCFGFWIDPSTKEFKFIIVDVVVHEDGEVGWGDPVGMKGIVYSSVRRDWREIPDVELGDWLPHPTVMIKGVVHWRGTRSADNAHMILSFDFILERFDTIEMPVWDGKKEATHFHWQGNLSVLVNDHGYSACNNCMLFMRQEGSWVKMFDFNLVPSLKNVFWVLGEEQRDCVLVGHDRNEMVFYDTRIGKLSFPDGDSDSDDDRIDHICAYDTANVAYDFVESLLFP